MPNAIIFDIEATDKDNPVLVEAAWVALDSVSPFTLGEEFHQRYNPGKPISLGALATHHIMDDELVDCPPSSSFTLPADTTYFKSLVEKNTSACGYLIAGETIIRPIRCFSRHGVW